MASPSPSPQRLRSTVFAMLALALLGLGALLAAGYAFSSGVAIAGLSSSPPDSTVLADSARRLCKGEDGEARNACYEKFLVPLVASHGVRVAMGTLNRLGARDTDVQADGHVFAHAIGITAGKNSDNVAETFASCTETFQSGCYHGVIQAYFETVDAVNSESVNALCRSYSTSTADQWLRFQCVHGMGHGLTMFYEHHLLRALEACDLLGQSWDRESCYGGAFMENIVNATAPHHPASALGDEHAHHSHAAPVFQALDPTDLHYPCSIVPERYVAQCYQMQTSVMLFFTGGDIEAAVQACLEAPAGMRAACHQSLGRDISAYARQKHKKAVQMCSLADAIYQPWCHVGVAKNLIDLTAREEDGMAYCRAVPGKQNRLKCYEAVGEQLGVLHNQAQDRAAGCARVEEEYREACRYGARLSSVRPSGLSTDGES